MPTGFLASALVPPFCEEAIRSSYLFYLGDRGRRRRVVLSLAAVFVIGELLYDLSLFPAARAEVGDQLAIILLLVALTSGAALHIALTFWTAARQRRGAGVWLVFAIALIAHGLFNLAGIGLVGMLA